MPVTAYLENFVLRWAKKQESMIFYQFDNNMTSIKTFQEKEKYWSLSAIFLFPTFEKFQVRMSNNMVHVKETENTKVLDPETSLLICKNISCKWEISILADFYIAYHVSVWFIVKVSFDMLTNKKTITI